MAQNLCAFRRSITHIASLAPGLRVACLRLLLKDRLKKGPVLTGTSTTKNNKASNNTRSACRTKADTTAHGRHGAETILSGMN